MQSEKFFTLTESIRRLKAETKTVEAKTAHLGGPKRIYDTGYWQGI